MKPPIGFSSWAQASWFIRSRGAAPPPHISCATPFITDLATAFGVTPMVLDEADSHNMTADFSTGAQTCMATTAAANALMKADMTDGVGYVVGIAVGAMAQFTLGQVGIMISLLDLGILTDPTKLVLVPGATNGWSSYPYRIEALLNHTDGTKVASASPKDVVFPAPVERVFLVVTKAGGIFIVANGVACPFYEWDEGSQAPTATLYAWDFEGLIPAATASPTTYGGMGTYVSGSATGTALTDAADMPAGDFPDLSAYGVFALKDFCGNTIV